MYSWAHTSLSWYYKLNLWGYRDNQICEVVWHFFSKAQNWKSFHPNIKSRPTALCRYGKQQKWFIIWIYYLSYYLIIIIIIIILLLSITGASYTDAAKPLRDLLCCAQIHTLQPSPQLHRLSFKKNNLNPDKHVMTMSEISSSVPTHLKTHCFIPLVCLCQCKQEADCIFWMAAFLQKMLWIE